MPSGKDDSAFTKSITEIYGQIIIIIIIIIVISREYFLIKPTGRQQNKALDIPVERTTTNKELLPRENYNIGSIHIYIYIYVDPNTIHTTKDRTKYTKDKTRQNTTK